MSTEQISKENKQCSIVRQVSPCGLGIKEGLDLRGEKRSRIQMNWLKTKVMGSGKLLNDITIDGSMPGVCIKQVRGK